MKFDIISIGSSVQDIFILNKDLKYIGSNISHPFNPDMLGKKINVGHMYFDIGGGGTNTATTFSNMGLKTALISQVGNDDTGKKIISAMKKMKINTSLVNYNRHEQTGYSVIFIDKTGDRTALIFRGSSDFKHFNLPGRKLNSDWLFVTSLNGNLKILKQIFDIAEKTNIKIAWNPGNQEISSAKALSPFLKKINVLLLNLKEAQTLTHTKSKNIKTILSKLKTLSPASIHAVTNGQQGAYVTDTLSTLYSPILNKKVVNATGAGDAFGSGFVAGLILYSGDIKKSLSLAMLNSNSVVTKMGAKHGLLTKPPTNKNLNKIKISTI